ncbi:MAG: UvrD-helicase domain-containing protein, partial [Myxococcota bacterium]
MDERSTFERAFRTVLRTELAKEAGPRAWLERWLARRSLEALIDLVFTCQARGGRISPALDEPGAQSALQTLAQAPTHPRAVRPMLVRGGLRGKALADTLEAVMRLAEIGAQAQGQLPAFLEQIGGLERPLELSGLADTLEAASDRQPGLRHLASAVRALASSAPSFDSAVVQVILPRVARQARAEKSARGELDFSDMLALMEESLYDLEGEALVANLRSRFPVALIDEFQDTDRVQWRIFRRLYLDDGADGRLFVIGDPKQAIYGFRGADVRTYLRAREEIEAAGGVRVRLTENFRSTAPLVDALDTLFDPEAPEPFFPGPIVFERVAAGRKEASALHRDGQSMPPALLIEPELGEGRATVGQAERNLADRIAHEIGLLLSPRSALVTGEASRALRPNDIFVLTRSVREARRVSGAMLQQGLPVALLAPEDVLRSEEARDVLVLLGALAQPQDDSLRLRAWATPFFAVPPATLGQLRDPPPGDPRLARLLAWKALADRRNYAKLFRSVLEESQVVERQIFLDDPRRLTNYLHLFELLEAEAARGQPPLDELRLRLSLYVEGRARPEGEGTMERLSSDRAAVQVMTMHKAKGLEAEVVFLFGGASDVPAELHTLPTPQGTALHLGREAPAEARAEADAETRRLLYVALTRARTQVYVPSFAGLELDRLGGLQAVLEPHLERARASGRGWAVAPRSAEPVPTAVSKPATTVARLLGASPPRAGPREGRDPRARPLVTSYSRLKAELGGSASRPRLDPELD